MISAVLYHEGYKLGLQDTTQDRYVASLFGQRRATNEAEEAYFRGVQHGVEDGSN